MAGVHLEFDAAVAEENEEPVTFDLRLPDRNADGSIKRDDSGQPVLVRHTFTCSDDLGAMPLLELASVSELGADTAEGLGALYRFIRAIVVAEEWPKFRDLTTRNKVKPETILAIVQGVMPHLVGRPTGGPSASASTPSPSGPDSKVVSLSPAAEAAGS
jgi:hypothetical protein